MNDIKLLYYCQNNHWFAIKLIYKKYYRLVYKICWLYYRKYPLLYSDFELAITDAKFVFFESLSKYKSEKKVTFKYFFCLYLKYYFVQKIRTNLNNKNKALSTSLSYNKIENYENILKNDEEELASLVWKKIFYNETLKSLDEEERGIIKLWSEGYKYKEISEIKNLSIKKIDNKIQSIIKLKKKNMEL